MTRHLSAAVATFTGAEGNRLVADVFGNQGAPVLLLHGGGQTRHAWRATAEAIARTGHVAYAIDQRGHGDSDWSKNASYGVPHYAADVTIVADELTRRGGVKPSAIGASLGGIASLIAEGDAEKKAGRSLFSSLVLVDITPRVDHDGIAKIQAFMRAHAKDGFASVDDAATAVASYLPHRPKPKSNQGLKKNLRMSPDGRWRWHWDPRFIDGPSRVGADREKIESMMVEAARRIRIPALLVRGGSSELVREAHVKEFLDLVPHAEYVDVADARHMVAGDRNDHFSSAVMDFLGKLDRKAGMRKSAVTTSQGKRVE
jgi:pimeloyl-ACP methyl ester carboxylesterase